MWHLALRLASAVHAERQHIGVVVVPKVIPVEGAHFLVGGDHHADLERAGRSLCFMDGDEPNLVWTDDEHAVGAEANVWQGTGQPAAESLLRQWECCLRPQ